MDIRSMTVTQITQLLAQNDVTIHMINGLKQDSRLAVGRLLARWQQKQQKLLLEKQRVQSLYEQECLLERCGYNLVAGVDEVGRGAGVAEIYACACILKPEYPIEGLKDSKKLSPRKREILAVEIKKYALSWCIAKASILEIEELNVHHATLLAMKRSIEGLSVKPDKAFVDGIHLPELSIAAEAIVKGDDKVSSISAASILAKVARDQAMIEYHKIYPEYGFDNHKGYFTKEHMAAIKKFGPCPIHRKSYAPIRELLELGNRVNWKYLNG